MSYKLAAVLVMCLGTPLAAGPILTTIQDTIYNADGTPYNGFAVVKWTPFQAGDTTQIATQQVTVNISGGNLMVQLVPTTNAVPAGYYTVTFTSAGNDQFVETWAVPPAMKALRVADVLLSPANSPSSLVTGSSIPESNVIGLLADLSARPVEGAGYATGRVAVIDATGALDGISGNVSDCVHVDGSTGPCGTAGTSTGPTFADAEVLAGAANGSNATFTVSTAPTPSSSLALYRNGILQKAGLDYTLAGNTIQFTAAAIPQAGDTLLASYRVTPTGAPQGPPAPEILCTGAGTATSSTTLSNLGTCTVPAGTLAAGDRVKISFDFSHEGPLTGFTFAVNWGNTVLVRRNGAVSDALVTGRAEAAAGTAACQLSVQSWGTVLGLAAGVLNGYDSLAYPLVLAFQGQMAATTTDTLTLRNFSVVRYPATQ